MAKERLSKLQKWILKRCYENIKPELPNGGLWRRSITTEFFGHVTPSTEAAVSRSIWSMISREYLQGMAPIKVSNLAMVYGMNGMSLDEVKKQIGDLIEKPNEKVSFVATKGINKAKLLVLTDKGKKKAKALLKLSS